jgi:hypothetical protein
MPFGAAKGGALLARKEEGAAFSRAEPIARPG